MKFTKEIIAKAWEIRKTVAKEIGCRVNDVLWGGCLEMASEVKVMNGTPKQVSWATDIKSDNNKKLNFVICFVNNSDEIVDESKSLILDLIKTASLDAKFWIESRSLFAFHSDNFDIEEDERTGLKMASNKCRRVVEFIASMYM